MGVRVLQSDAIKKAQGVSGGIAALPAQLAFVVKENQILLDLVGTKSVWTAVVVSCKR